MEQLRAINNDSNKPLVCTGGKHEGEIQEDIELLSHPLMNFCRGLSFHSLFCLAMNLF